MTQTAVATEVHQTLDVHVDFAAQVTFGGQLGHLVAQRIDLLFAQFLDLYYRADASGSADALCGGATYTIDVGQRDNSVLVIRNVYACNTGHSEKLQLTATRRPGSQERARILAL